MNIYANPKIIMALFVLYHNVKQVTHKSYTASLVRGLLRSCGYFFRSQRERAEDIAEERASDRRLIRITRRDMTDLHRIENHAQLLRDAEVLSRYSTGIDQQQYNYVLRLLAREHHAMTANWETMFTTPEVRDAK